MAAPQEQADAALALLAPALLQLRVVECIWNRLWLDAVWSPNTTLAVFSSLPKVATKTLDIVAFNKLFKTYSDFGTFLATLDPSCGQAKGKAPWQLAQPLIGRCLGVGLKKFLAGQLCPLPLTQGGISLSNGGQYGQELGAVATKADRLRLIAARAVVEATADSVQPLNKTTIAGGPILPTRGWFLSDRGGPVGCAPYVVRMWRALRTALAQASVTSSASVAALPPSKVWATAKPHWPGKQGNLPIYLPVADISAAHAAVSVVAMWRTLRTAPAPPAAVSYTPPPSMVTLVAAALSATVSGQPAPPTSATGPLSQWAQAIDGAPNAVAAFDQLATFALNRFALARACFAALVALRAATPEIATLALPLLRSWSLITGFNAGETCMSTTVDPTLWAQSVLSSPAPVLTKIG